MAQSDCKRADSCSSVGEKDEGFLIPPLAYNSGRNAENDVRYIDRNSQHAYGKG